ncbi:MAG: glycosyl hydrolase 115 family protein [Clostridia bacterium]|nr:glycosyl hydrolase 115 family protein [Clostridia bacterium]
MDFIISSTQLKKGVNAVIYDRKALSGVKKIASKFAGDIKAVFGTEPELLEDGEAKSPICVGTVGDKLITKLGVDISDIEGKREVYKIEVKDGALIITGSDKRGTIYGMFKISEMLGVSPFIDWLDIQPVKQKDFKIPGDYCMVSKEPSVKFRGFFINDEWPAFGNYCNKRFGGFNAKVYEHVFELLLRLKGNYMWPAMWAAIFPNDGPGLKNCELADELGVVMGMSHHEPCLRQGEEYKYLRGPKSKYGDAWNFLTNEKGITKFWEDGLKRSGKFENVVTVGMRGEADTAIMGKDATLKDNIDLLRKVLKTQNKLIKKYVNEDLDKVPRMLALYKEVEPYFYGDDKTPGLMGDPELEGVTLMLCDDNFGNLRTVPTPKMRKHKGGYGMYYHFDYHGLPVSFEWFNTSHISKVWEQMTTAYDFGIRDLWIVNVGDIFSNEYPLSYFLELAYDFDRWGTGNFGSAKEYTRLMVDRNFKGKMTSAELKKCAELLEGYTRITSARRTEAMNDQVYQPFSYNEAFETLEKVEKLMSDAQKLYDKLEGNTRYAFYELIWLPLTANMNVQRMWLLTTLNHGFAQIGSTYAMTLGDKINECISYDRKIVDELHKIHDGMWYGMGLSEHIGFNAWCEEGCKYPVVHRFEPANKERLIVLARGSNWYSEGKFWTGHVPVVDTFLDPSKDEAELILTTAGTPKANFKVENPNAFLSVSETEGTVKPFTMKVLKIKLDRNKFKKAAKVPEICIHCADGNVVVKLPVNKAADVGAGKKSDGTYYWCGRKIDMNETVINAPLHQRTWPNSIDAMDYISIEAKDFYSKTDSAKGGFKVIEDYSRGFDAVKAYPQDIVFGKDAPKLTYRVCVPRKGEYGVTLYVNPSNPHTRDNEIWFGISANDGRMKKVNMINPYFAVGDGNPYWSLGVLENKREITVHLNLKEGMNEINIFAIDPNLVLQKLVIYEGEDDPARSYLGPKPTFKS